MQLRESLGIPKDAYVIGIVGRLVREKGFFEKESLKVQLITFRGTNLMLTALLTGDLDYATILPFLTGAAARGLPVRILAAVTKSSSHSDYRHRRDAEKNGKRPG